MTPLSEVSSGEGEPSGAGRWGTDSRSSRRHPFTHITKMVGGTLIGFLAFAVAAHAIVSPNMFESGQVDEHSKAEESEHFWRLQTADELNKRLSRRLNENQAKNVIFFLGDGMSVATVTAARIYAGQMKGASGEETSLAFDEFPYTGFAKTYCVNSQVADSACSATAFLTGVKSQKGTLGVNGRVSFGDCDTAQDQSTHTKSILQWAQEAGKGTGIITTSSLTDATPAATYAHSANRSWESDADVIASCRDPFRCQDIASQMVESLPGKKLNVILGGGRSAFYAPNHEATHGPGGARKDGRDLIKEWVLEKSTNVVAGYVPDRATLRGVNYDSTQHLLGIFNNGYMDYNLTADTKKEPTLSEMVEAAISVLKKFKDGYVLFVEGGRIDHGHHGNLAQLALDETVMLSDAVRTAVQMSNPDNTLVVVTADHAHVMTMAGYPGRGTDILGIAGTSDVDKLPYTTLTYANGPSAIKKEMDRTDIFLADTRSPNYMFPSLVPLDLETHGGEDVGVYATGPWAHLFTGVYEQSYIPGAIMYAACLGPSNTACKKNRKRKI